MFIKICAFTDTGKRLQEKIISKLDTDIFLPRTEKKVSDWTGECFDKRLPIVFIGATGIAVRMISPYVKDKFSDSPVIVIDEKGQYVIPILSGHLGGANELAKKIAAAIGAEAVITTATDVQNKFSIDLFARDNNLEIVNREGIVKLSQKILRGETISVAIEDGLGIKLPDDLNYVSYDFGMCTVSEGKKAEDEKNFQAENSTTREKKSYAVKKPAIDLLIGCNVEDKPALLTLRTKPYILGMGCRKGKDFESLRSFLETELKANLGIEKNEIFGKVRAIATIDLKKDEPGLMMLAQYYRLPLITYTSDQLKSLEGDFSHSDFVEKTTGVSGVCERAAIFCARSLRSQSGAVSTKQADGLVVKKIARDGMTLAVSTIN